ncbi:hypothetical protein [Dyella choica]|uniref:Uncharacterized protein n=1 Tax=Dyella choica TaxID=1927959 RepID=A0A432M9M6_9GAMM|nr:hypothetical protein [Dyella choica]RUL77688.1 hypothetical protein EKH80_07405 [Dyella choica]
MCSTDEEETVNAQSVPPNCHARYYVTADAPNGTTLYRAQAAGGPVTQLIPLSLVKLNLEAR